MVGMPSQSDAGIMFGDGSNNRIDATIVNNTSYHGISVLHNRNTIVSNSTVDGACIQLTDCAGIYTGARDRLPLNLRIEKNSVRNVYGINGGIEGIAIYLDDYANGVTVNGNTVTNNDQAIVLHNAFDIVITNNNVSSSRVRHVCFGQDSGNIHNVQITSNTFNSTNNEKTFSLETGQNLTSFATYDYNTYKSTNTNVFAASWTGSGDGITYSYSSWKLWMGQDAHSTMNGLP
jgi:parallel beta-helix repeat protein